MPLTKALSTRYVPDKHLHNIGEIGGKVAVDQTDSLTTAPSERYDYVLTTPFRQEGFDARQVTQDRYDKAVQKRGSKFPLLPAHKKGEGSRHPQA